MLELASAKYVLTKIFERVKRDLTQVREQWRQVSQEKDLDIKQRESEIAQRIQAVKQEYAENFETKYQKV